MIFLFAIKANGYTKMICAAVSCWIWWYILCWFYAQETFLIINVVLLNIIVQTIIHFRILWETESSKEHLCEI